MYVHKTAFFKSQKYLQANLERNLLRKCFYISLFSHDHQLKIQNLYHYFLESVKLRALCALLLHVSVAVRTIVPHVLHALCAIMPYVPRALFALISYVSRASCTFCSTYFHISHALMRYVPLVPHAWRPSYVNNTFSAPFFLCFK